MTVRAFHPVANAFPLMVGKEFDDLVEDVRAHGLHEPIWLHQDGRIIDGRNRYRACMGAGVEPKFQPYIGPEEELAAFVVSKNVRRRHLNESQRAMVSASLADLAIGANQHEEGVSIETASRLLNVSRATTARARKVKREAAPEVVEAVHQGMLTVSDAAAIAFCSVPDQRAMLQAVESGSGTAFAPRCVARPWPWCGTRLDIAASAPRTAICMPARTTAARGIWRCELEAR